MCRGSASVQLSSGTNEPGAAPPPVAAGLSGTEPLWTPTGGGNASSAEAAPPPVGHRVYKSSGNVRLRPAVLSAPVWRCSRSSAAETTRVLSQHRPAPHLHTPVAEGKELSAVWSCHQKPQRTEKQRGQRPASCCRGERRCGATGQELRQKAGKVHQQDGADVQRQGEDKPRRLVHKRSHSRLLFSTSFFQSKNQLVTLLLHYKDEAHMRSLCQRLCWPAHRKTRSGFQAARSAPARLLPTADGHPKAAGAGVERVGDQKAPPQQQQQPRGSDTNYQS